MHGLGNDLAIKGIAVVKRQVEQMEGVPCGVREYTNVQILNGLARKSG